MDDRQHFDLDSVIPFLLDRNLITLDAIVSNDVSVVAEPRRNRNFRVEVADSGYFIKHPEKLSAGSLQSTANEAKFLLYAASIDGTAARFLPTLVLEDSELHLTVLELLPRHQTLWAYFETFQYPQFPIRLCANVGRALGELHAVLANVGPSHAPPAWLKSTPPWVGHIHMPAISMLSSLTPGAEEVISIVQKSDVMGAALDQIPKLWKPHSIIHGDIKADNILLEPDCDFRFVDWEMAQLGDPAWDVAGFIQELVMVWLMQFARMPSADVQTALDEAKLPWAVVRLAIQRFWRAYLEYAGVAASQRKGVATTVTHYVAARMIQTAYEATMSRWPMSAPVVLCMQICDNILADVRHAARNFLGLIEEGDAS